MKLHHTRRWTAARTSHGHAPCNPPLPGECAEHMAAPDARGLPNAQDSGVRNDPSAIVSVPPRLELCATTTVCQNICSWLHNSLEWCSCTRWAGRDGVDSAALSAAWAGDVSSWIAEPHSSMGRTASASAHAGGSIARAIAAAADTAGRYELGVGPRWEETLLVV